MTGLTYLLIARHQPAGDHRIPPIWHQAANAAIDGLWGNWRNGEVGSTWEAA